MTDKTEKKIESMAAPNLAESNLAIWERHADVDPKYTKAIVGKPYSGTSPNPHYVIKCLTEMFGPVGIGFGWEVQQEAFEKLSDQVLHWCRIRFWHTDRANGYDAYGQTMAVYTTRKGVVIVDEDAPKKSLTDAITKAASQLGISANIFLGRWDDNKYVAGVNSEFRSEESPQPKEPAKLTAEQAVDHIIARINACTTLQALNDGLADGKPTALAWDKLIAERPDLGPKLVAAKEAKIAALEEEAALLHHHK